MKIAESKLATTHPELVDSLEALLDSAQKLGANIELQRLTFVCEHYDKLSPDVAYNWINPGIIQLEIEEAQARKVEIWHLIRNCLAVLPIIFTWFALFFAATSYQRVLVEYPKDLNQPLLELWQNGFHGATGFTFATAALIDVGLLILFLSSIVLTHFLDVHARNNSVAIVKDLHEATEQLIKVVGYEGVFPVASEADIDKVTAAVKQVVGHAVKETKRVTESAMQSVEKVTEVARETIKQSIEKVIQTSQDAFKETTQETRQAIEQAVQAAKLPIEQLTKTTQLSIEQVSKATLDAITISNKQVEELLSNQIGPTIVGFRADMATLQKELSNYQDRLTALTTASKDLAEVSTSLAAKADTYTTIGQDIDTRMEAFHTQIGVLNLTQETLATQIEALATHMQSVEGSFSSAAGSMDSATNAIGMVSEGMTTNIDAMTKLVSRAAENLGLVEKYLGGTAYYLSQTNDQLLQVTTQLRDVTDSLAGLKIVDGGVMGWALERWQNRNRG